MKSGIRSSLTALLLLGAMLSGCKDDSNGGGDGGGGGGGGGGGTGAEAGYVVGKVVDRKGKPLANVQIFIDDTIVYSSGISGKTDANGNYKVKMSGGVWRAFAEMPVTYNGSSYKEELHPDNPQTFAGSDAAVRNFEWRLQGDKPEPRTGYYGGTVNLNTDPNAEIPDIEKVEFTFSPVGPLIDGNPGDVITARSGSLNSGFYFKIKDIPIGRYSITARYVDTSVPALPLKIRVDHVGNYADSVTADFVANANTCNRCMSLEIIDAAKVP